MRCWKCGREVVDGTSVCPYCGTAQATRSAPASEVGRAMRMLYDRYGAREVLTNSAYLVNGLADLTDVDKKLRNQLRMAMDAGLGRAYLEQLNAGGPDAAFDSRVKVILTEDAGLSDKAAGTLAEYFDEMIGWRGAARPEQQPPQPARPAEKKAPGWNEVDRTGRYTAPKAEAGPEVRREAPPPQPNVQREQKTDRAGLYLYEKAAVVCILLTFVLGSVINPGHDPAFTGDYVVSALMLIPLFLSFGVARRDLRRTVHGGAFGLTVLVGAMLVFIAFDGVQKISLIRQLQLQTGAAAQERLLWQQHLAQEDMISFFTALLLLIQMIRHRILETNGSGS